MVGIVLVSHSHGVAEGAAELARQMGGEEVRVETAGGLDGPEHEIGTDAVLVMQAIERAWSDDGVLVLMDLGSAVLSAEMALDLLPASIDRSRVLLTDAPFVEGAVAAAVSARIDAPLERVADEARGGLAGKSAHLGVGLDADPAIDPGAGAAISPTDDGDAPGGLGDEIEFVVRTEHGLHARPAAALVRTASSFDAEVRVENRSRGGPPVSARSLNAVATLGVRRGDRVGVTASGSQAAKALEAVRLLAERNFDEPAAVDRPPAAMSVAGAVDHDAPTLTGIAASPGEAIGPVARFRAAELAVPDRPPGPLDIERRALERALAETREDVIRQRETSVRRVGVDEAGIFDAHLLLLDDEALAGRALVAVDGGAAGAVAWREAVDAVAATWDAMDDGYLRARAADVRSVGTQVLARLLGVAVPVPSLSTPGIVVAADLAPADTVGLDPALALGLATAAGGPTSHAAVIARSLGIPAVVGLGPRILALEDGTDIAIDGDRGVVEIAPPAERIAAIATRRRERADAERIAVAQARSPAATRDGTAIEVAANIGSVADARRAVAAGCDAVGLFRTEFLFLDRPTLPDEGEQAEAYRAVADALDGRPLIARTLDVGADKPLPSVDRPAEANPFLGVRGIRLGLERQDLLETQVRALLRVAADHEVRIMFPMVSTLDELRAARAVVDAAAAALRHAGVAVPERLDVGVMIEVPSAALGAGALAREADFFSIGTNDLTQYTLAAERGNAGVAAIADPLHPAVLELIRRTCDAGRWTGVCGELAGDPLATPLLLGLGVRELSMSPPAIPFVKRAVRATDFGEATRLAERALACDSAAEVRALLAEA